MHSCAALPGDTFRSRPPREQPCFALALPLSGIASVSPCASSGTNCDLRSNERTPPWIHASCRDRLDSFDPLSTHCRCSESAVAGTFPNCPNEPPIRSLSALAIWCFAVYPSRHLPAYTEPAVGRWDTCRELAASQRPTRGRKVGRAGSKAPEKYRSATSLCQMTANTSHIPIRLQI